MTNLFPVKKRQIECVRRLRFEVGQFVGTTMYARVREVLLKNEIDASSYSRYILIRVFITISFRSHLVNNKAVSC